MTALRRALGTTVGVAAVALLVATTGFLLLQLVLFQPGRDQGIYSVVADGILRGLAPYRDRWDFKPPGIYFIYAAARALFGRTAMAARVVEAAALASGIGASAILSKRHLGDARPGWLAGSLAILNHVQLEFWHTGQPESFGGILLLWAIVFVGHRSASARRQHAAWAMGGALYACAGLLKPPLGGGMLVSAWLISRALRREGAPTRARLLALEAIFAGALLPVLATIAWFARHGALGDAIETLFVFAPGYTRLSLQSHSVWQLCAGTVRELVRVIAVPSLIGCALWALLPSGAAREGETPLHLIGALAPQLLGVALQAKLFPYHYGGIVPLAALFAGWGLWRIGRRLTHPAAALLGLMLLTLLVYESPPVTPDLCG